MPLHMAQLNSGLPSFVDVKSLHGDLLSTLPTEAVNDDNCPNHMLVELMRMKTAANVGIATGSVEMILHYSYDKCPCIVSPSNASSDKIARERQ